MQQSACDPLPRGSSDFINKWERIGPKQCLNGVCRPCKPRREPKIGPPVRREVDSSHFFSNQPANVRLLFVLHVAMKVLGLPRRRECPPGGRPPSSQRAPRGR